MQRLTECTSCPSTVNIMTSSVVFLCQKQEIRCLVIEYLHKTEFVYEYLQNLTESLKLSTDLEKQQTSGRFPHTLTIFRNVKLFGAEYIMEIKSDLKKASVPFLF